MEGNLEVEQKKVSMTILIILPKMQHLNQFHSRRRRMEEPIRPSAPRVGVSLWQRAHELCTAAELVCIWSSDVHELSVQRCNTDFIWSALSINIELDVLILVNSIQGLTLAAWSPKLSRSGSDGEPA